MEMIVLMMNCWCMDVFIWRCFRVCILYEGVNHIMIN